MRILITGGAGFVGSFLARELAGLGHEVVAFDNLRRRGSELNLPLLRGAGVPFVHGDIRRLEDLQEVDGDFDVMLEASAEPSVLAGTDGSTRYLVDTNLVGTLNALDFCRQRQGAMLFLSTNRVFSISALRELPLIELETRWELEASACGQGFRGEGINEAFPATGRGPRSLYGMTKLASEMLIEEYCATFGLRALINRCGVLAGPGQFGETDQGVFTLWVARHLFGGPLSYTGFGGKGKQVRDLLHPRDLLRLIGLQLDSLNQWSGKIYNVGGGLSGSVSLLEYTAMCVQETGRMLDIGSQPHSAAVDIPYYATDFSKASAEFGWAPETRPDAIVSEIAHWLSSDEEALRPLFC